MLHPEHGLPGPEAMLGPGSEDIHVALVETVSEVAEGDRSFVLVPQSSCLLGRWARR